MPFPPSPEVPNPCQCITTHALLVALVSDPKHILPPLIHIEARRDHGHHLDISNRQPNEEAPPAAFSPDRARDLHHAQAMSVSDRAADLHAPSDDFERVARGLAHEAGDAAGEELRPAGELGGLAAVAVGARDGGVGGETRVAEEIVHEVVREEGEAGVGEHTPERGDEAAVEVGEAVVRDGA